MNLKYAFLFFISSCSKTSFWIVCLVLGYDRFLEKAREIGKKPYEDKFLFKPLLILFH